MGNYSDYIAHSSKILDRLGIARRHEKVFDENMAISMAIASALVGIGLELRRINTGKLISREDMELVANELESYRNATMSVIEALKSTNERVSAQRVMVDIIGEMVGLNAKHNS